MISLCYNQLSLNTLQLNLEMKLCVCFSQHTKANWTTPSILILYYLLSVVCDRVTNHHKVTCYWELFRQHNISAYHSQATRVIIFRLNDVKEEQVSGTRNITCLAFAAGVQNS